jgi:uncharacterized protein
MPQELMLSGSCYPGRRKLFVDTNGTLYMCEKFGERISIGNVDSGLNQDSINSSIEEFKGIKNELCQDCWAQRVCTPCIQSAKDSEREISIKGLAQTCASSKKEILTSIALYAEIVKNKKEFIEIYLSPQLNEMEVKHGKSKDKV